MCLSASNWEMELRAMQKVAIRVLSGEEVSEDVYRSLQKFVKEEGVNALFYDQDEWFPTGDDDTVLTGEERADPSLQSVLELGRGSDDQDVRTLLDKRKDVQIEDEWMVQSYLWEKLRGIKDKCGVERLLEQTLWLELEHPDDYSDYDTFIGDLYFALGRYVNALERYRLAFARGVHYDYGDRGSNAIFNVLWKLERQPDLQVVLACNAWMDSRCGEALGICEHYLEKRLSVEISKQGNYLSWVHEQHDVRRDYKVGVFHCVSSIEGERVRKRIGVPDFYCFAFSKQMQELSKLLHDDAMALNTLSAEVKNIEKVLNGWEKSLKWYRQFRMELPDEEIVFHYRTPWLWKFHFDLFFPNRSLAIVFFDFRDLQQNDFVQGVVGKIQLEKQWMRALKKAESKYGVRVVVLPYDYNETSVRLALDGCLSNQISS